jgi:hypothetical protein
MAAITTTRTVKFHGDKIAKGAVLEAQATEGGWLVAHPRVEGAFRMIPEDYAEEVATTTYWQHRDGLVVFA